MVQGRLKESAISSGGRVVKAIDSKSIGLCPHSFESCPLRGGNHFFAKCQQHFFFLLFVCFSNTYSITETCIFQSFCHHSFLRVREQKNCPYMCSWWERQTQLGIRIFESFVHAQYSHGARESHCNRPIAVCANTSISLGSCCSS